MKYGDLPIDLGKSQINCEEMFFYQYLPIKLIGSKWFKFEKRLNCFSGLISDCCLDFSFKFGHEAYVEHYIYLTAKRMYQFKDNYFNRKGYHTDGFMTDDINYIWSDSNPTIFNTSDFKLTQDDNVSMLEMEEQADYTKMVSFPKNTLLRLNQFNVHKVNENEELKLRTFFKLSFSKDKYDLKGNSKNHLLDYNWEMRDRKPSRNIPQLT